MYILYICIICVCVCLLSSFYPSALFKKKKENKNRSHLLPLILNLQCFVSVACGSVITFWSRAKVAIAAAQTQTENGDRGWSRRRCFRCFSVQSLVEEITAPVCKFNVVVFLTKNVEDNTKHEYLDHMLCWVLHSSVCVNFQLQW